MQHFEKEHYIHVYFYFWDKIFLSFTYILDRGVFQKPETRSISKVIKPVPTSVIPPVASGASFSCLNVWKELKKIKDDATWSELAAGGF